MRVTISKKKNHEGIVGKKFGETYGKYEERFAKQHIQEIVKEYESEINANGHELDDQDKKNDIEAVTNLKEGFYDFDCGDFTYYIEIK